MALQSCRAILEVHSRDVGERWNAVDILVRLLVMLILCTAIQVKEQQGRCTAACLRQRSK